MSHESMGHQNKYTKSETNEPISQIKPIRDADDQMAIRQLILKKEMVQQVVFGFWGTRFTIIIYVES